VGENDAEPKVMDIRQLREEKPKLGWLTDVRFSILHNHRKLAELETLVAAYLKANGSLKVATRENLFEFTPDGERVNLVVREGRKLDGLPYQAAPEALQLFCNEAVTLHKNQHLFWHLTEDEIRQVAADYRDLAGSDGIVVKKGRHSLVLQIEDGKLAFRAFE
jgi:RNase P/RNase MRP subunit p29